MGTTDAPSIEQALELFFGLGISLGIGVLIGLERQLSHLNQSRGLGGVRTFAMVAVFGFVATLMGSVFNPWITVASLFSMATLLTLSHVFQMREGRKGITTEVSLLVTFLLGMLTEIRYSLFAVGVALLISFLLSLKLKIQNVVQQITEEELFAIFKFLVAGVLVLPFLPDRAIDPWLVIKPREVWTVVVLVLSVSFFGYLLIKFRGASHGAILTGFLGGLVSSTIVTWIFSNRSRRDPGHSMTYGLATVLAISIMFPRIYLLSRVVNPAMGARLAMPFAVLFLTGTICAYVIQRRLGQGHVNGQEAVVLGNPFNIGDALKFALMFSGILVVVSLANTRFGAVGVYVVSAISGLASVDAIAISMARLAGDQIPLSTALNATLIAALANNVVIFCISASRGSGVYWRTVGGGIACIFAVAGAWMIGMGW